MTRRLTLVALLFTTATLVACRVPRFDGPQIQSPPIGFLLQNETYLQRRAFPDREVTFHTAWVHTELSGVSVIYLNAHPGAFTLDDVVAAQDAARAAARDPDRKFGPLEPLDIDGREAWGWEERVESTSRGLVDVAYRAVIPYDTVTWAIEFESGEPSFKRASPDTLRAVIGSFAYGETQYNIPLIAMAGGALLLLLSIGRTRSRERARRRQRVNLVAIPKKDAEDEGGGGPSSTTGSPPT